MRWKTSGLLVVVKERDEGDVELTVPMERSVRILLRKT